jgi:hypothetical protein
VVNDPAGIFDERDKAMHKWLDTLNSIKEREGSLLSRDANGDLDRAYRSIETITGYFDRIKESEIKYALYFDPKIQSGVINHGYTTMDTSTETIVMVFGQPTKTREEVIHEIIHGIQYLDGKISFRRQAILKDGKLVAGSFGTLYDVNDETEAYRLARIVADYSTVRSEWTNKETIAIDRKAYGYLSGNDITIDSKDGRELRQRTYWEGVKDTVNSEFYFNWERDYGRGCNHLADSLGLRTFPKGSRCEVVLAGLPAKG